METFEHVKQIQNEVFRSRFVCVHDDRFGRCFKTPDDIIYSCNKFNSKNISIEIDACPVSRNKQQEINVFLLDVFYKEPIDDLDEFSQSTQLHGLSNLEWVQYYKCTPCDFDL